MSFRDLVAVVLVLFCSASAYAESTIFNPNKETTVTLTQDGSTLTVSAEGNGHSETRKIEIQAEKKLRLEIDDFNFDGVKDFAVWHVDDGMGVYTIFRVFVYKPRVGFFEEQRPACGDEFINLRVDKKNKLLKSTYYKGNEPTLCITTLSRK
ncbi:hypothetical protein [Pseudomonas purpurea]|uniref:XAC2610-related protein n=1 Tax=Pseudomonas purpurea TaxID=3136737 RepID=UPI003266E410